MVPHVLHNTSQLHIPIHCINLNLKIIYKKKSCIAFVCLFNNLAIKPLWVESHKKKHPKHKWRGFFLKYAVAMQWFFFFFQVNLKVGLCSNTYWDVWVQWQPERLVWLQSWEVWRGNKQGRLRGWLTSTPSHPDHRCLETKEDDTSNQLLHFFENQNFRGKQW